MASKEDLPTYKDLMLPVLQAVGRLGGSATSRQITDTVIKALAPSKDLLEITYLARGGDESIYLNRLRWARSFCKSAGVLESPRRSLYLVTDLGREILAMGTNDAASRLADLNRKQQPARNAKATAKKSRPEDGTADETEILGDDAEAPVIDDEEYEEFKKALLKRLHGMSPEGFEQFTLHLLRMYGLDLEHVGRSGDRGIDGIGVAPMSPVLSAAVAVQVKRHDPSSSLGRDVVALFQRNAAAAGAERAILVTLGRYTKPAERVSRETTPTVDLIDGDRLCDLVLEKKVGMRNVPQVNSNWFTRFETRQKEA